MTEALVLALGVPTAFVAAWLLWRRSWSQAFADIRGIALQTVIVIVVMLVIAGGVAGVLLSRGTEVIGDLEASDVGAACTETSIRDSAGVELTGVMATATTCTFTASGTAASGITISALQCNSAGRVLRGPGAIAGATNVCTVTIS